jgi:hypothetical protein
MKGERLKEGHKGQRNTISQCKYIFIKDKREPTMGILITSIATMITTPAISVCRQ